jgi:hypothetical protein
MRMPRIFYAAPLQEIVFILEFLVYHITYELPGDTTLGRSLQRLPGSELPLVGKNRVER